MTISRRSFFTGLATLIAAPTIVRAESLMKLAPTRIIKPSFAIDLAVGEDMTVVWQMANNSSIAFIPYKYPVLSLDEYSARILAPMVNQLSQSIADTVMHGNGASLVTLEADGTGLLPKGAREQVPVIAPIRLSDLLRDARDHQFA